MKTYERLIGQFRAQRYIIGKSQTRLGYDLDVADGQMDKWERMIRRPTLWNAVHWAESMGCELILVRKGELDVRAKKIKKTKRGRAKQVSC